MLLDYFNFLYVAVALVPGLAMALLLANFVLGFFLGLFFRKILVCLVFQFVICGGALFYLMQMKVDLSRPGPITALLFGVVLNVALGLAGWVVGDKIRRRKFVGDKVQDEPALIVWKD